MIESKLSQVAGNRSILQQNWPPKWFFSYSDLATLLMTFFIILATMLSLKIPLYVFSDQKMQALIKEKAATLEEIRKLTELEKSTLRELEQMDAAQIQNIANLERMREFEKDIRLYLKEKDLEEFIKIEVLEWKIRVTPFSPFLFKGGSDVIRQEALPLLDEIAALAKFYPSRFRIEGHTDDTPIHNRRFSSNWELSIARANSIMRYLTEQHSIPISKVEAVGYGEYRPLVPNDSQENRRLNRRVVIELIPEIVTEKKIPLVAEAA